MQIDFHTHANLSKKITVSLDEFRDKVIKAKKNGLTALAITEHFNALNIIDFYESLQEAFPYKNDYYEIEGMKIFCGLEIDVQENGHFLVIGRREDIFTISSLLLPHHDEENFIPVKDLIKLLADFPVLKIAAHPLRESTPWTHHSADILAQFDAFDLNGKDLFTYGPEMENKVQNLAKQFGLPVVGGSDTHHELQYGAITNDFPECETIDELRLAIQHGNYEVEISPCLETKVEAARQVKKMIKQTVEV